MEKILIVEDDEKIALLEQDYLEINGYETVWLADGAGVVSELRSHAYDLVLLDVMLPGCSGYDICRQIRDEIDIPILMVTARTESVDAIRGLGLGADDYITKPFDPSLLVARVRSHLKRYARLTAGKSEGVIESKERIHVQDVVLEPKTWKVWKKGKELRLPNREFELLRFLAENPNIVFSKEELFEKIWGYDYISDAATVSVHIGRLREKIEEDPRDPKIIETVWGAGYRLNA
ncbi:MAG TPA: response regulator transcription factor [Candidatus Onthocola gallistercoris]|uniref:Response regulator transcription factor n=1 Tax=Candidatus Onthocola gallistercoris TaxID=2840876 RepID=A0A9D1HFX0_9FIRM|nr:response regulator transcription factor [Candidatus Onthocola gallistercoris]